MTPERWRRLKELFGECLGRSAEERASYLAQECAGDDALRAEVEALLAFHVETDEVLPDPATSLAAEPSAPERIGPYRLLRELGHGGMGTVHLAARIDDAYRRQVAIKVVRAGMDTEDVVSRFRAERQILASLQHPGIATLLDGGTTPDGHPYFVMEHVQGEPIDRWCDARRLPVADRLRLFLLVCAAVEHAHGRLVVHRDVKPGNILVTPDGQPKLLDFGLAKVLDPAQGDADQTTTQRRFVTPAFASPEQILGGTITTASDVYSLGALLFLLLTGRRPHGHSRSSHDDLVRAARQEPLRKPSSVVTQDDPAAQDDPSLRADALSAVREGSPEKLRRRLSGDLDAIVLKAMRREPEERYHSVEQLSEDVRRFLAGLPVAARRGGRWYQTRKFAARHAAALAVTALVIASLSAAFAETVRQRARAESRAEDLRRLAGSVVVQLNDAIANIPGTTQARADLVKRAKEYLDGLARESRDDLALKRDVAEAYVRLGRVQGIDQYASLGDVGEALASVRAATTLYEELHRARPGDLQIAAGLALSLHYTANARMRTEGAGGLEEARRAVALAEQPVAEAPAIVEYRRTLAICLMDLGREYTLGEDLGHARELYERAAALYEGMLPAERTRKDDTNLAVAYSNLGGLDRTAGKLEEAAVRCRAALAVVEPLLARQPDDALVKTTVAQLRQRLGDVLIDLRRLDAAEEQFRKALSAFRDLAAADPANSEAQAAVAQAQADIGNVLTDSAEPARALEWLRAAHESLPAHSSESFERTFLRGTIELALGRAEIAVARRGAAGALDHWRSGRSWSARAVETLAALDAQGKLPPHIAVHLRTAREQLSDCDAALAGAQR